ncbi:MAG: hypothetical protein KKF62_04685 [Bacteroidetes bacterium]|nr:hypothetical protein [Bacteroidota bacterium]MBU1114969.1 hypothetical protein [Bacteroidota bacterium]MBU1798707.1 hypothetical protein [Bacteroidota bacterium]
MDFSKQFIIQAISVASNNLRLSSDKIEAVAILREQIMLCDNLEESIRKMKSKTELSKFAIKLWEAFQFTKSASIDFLRLSDLFKEHSHILVMELSNLLDVVTPEKLREIFNSMNVREEISVSLGYGAIKTELPSNFIASKMEYIEENQTKEDVERDELKEDLILGEVKGTSKFNFDDFEEVILKPISKLENLLKVLAERKVEDEELIPFIVEMQKNAEFSEEIGFEVLTEMHTIFYTALIKIRDKKIVIDRNLIESLRACLIVIVAVVRGKDVNITNYLNKSENLGRFLKINKG